MSDFFKFSEILSSVDGGLLCQLRKVLFRLFLLGFLLVGQACVLDAMTLLWLRWISRLYWNKTTTTAHFPGIQRLL